MIKYLACKSGLLQVEIKSEGAENFPIGRMNNRQGYKRTQDNRNNNKPLKMSKKGIRGKKERTKGKSTDQTETKKGRRE